MAIGHQQPIGRGNKGGPGELSLGHRPAALESHRRTGRRPHRLAVAPEQVAQRATRIRVIETVGALEEHNRWRRADDDVYCGLGTRFEAGDPPKRGVESILQLSPNTAQLLVGERFALVRAELIRDAVNPGLGLCEALLENVVLIAENPD